jgi:hypothetical protein
MSDRPKEPGVSSAWRKLGFTIADYTRLIAQQNGGCAICGKPPRAGSRITRLHVDHQHGTKHVRGLLCWQCNYLLRPYVTAERLRLAAEYLDRNNV